MLTKENVAVILPLKSTYGFKRFLKSHGRELYVGKEYYTSGISAVTIDGSVELPLLKRIWAMSESGIKDWWHQLLRSNGYDNTSTNNTPMSANMSGNILVVFVVWLCGMAVSTLAILGEVCLQKLSAFGRRWNSFETMLRLRRFKSNYLNLKVLTRKCTRNRTTKANK